MNHINDGTCLVIGDSPEAKSLAKKLQENCRPGRIIPLTDKERKILNSSTVIGLPDKGMTDRDRLAEKLFINHVYTECNYEEAAEWAIDRANIFFNTLENNNEDK